jgi:hypothetical protein
VRKLVKKGRTLIGCKIISGNKPKGQKSEKYGKTVIPGSSLVTNALAIYCRQATM